MPGISIFEPHSFRREKDDMLIPTTTLKLSVTIGHVRLGSQIVIQLPMILGRAYGGSPHYILNHHQSEPRDVGM
jgi:hypothetical protein